MKQIDCRGMACPQPVLAAKDALDQDSSSPFRIVVDNAAARDNVTRFAQSQGCSVSVETVGGDFALTIVKEGPATGPPPEIVCPAPVPAQPRLVVRVAGQFMGSGSEELGRILMKAFLKTLSEATIRPEAVVFYNSGVLLACRGSENLDALKALESAGVKILSCGTCLDYYHRKSELGVGAITNMFEIIETLSAADRVVSP